MIEFTIIIPTYNCGRYIWEALNSIENQIFNKDQIEVLVIDDGSIDNTRKIVDNFKINSSLKINYFYKDNAGWGSVFNFVKFNKLAKGKYITILDADDVLNKKTLKRIAKVKEEFDLIFFDFTKKTNHRSFVVPVYPYFLKRPKNTKQSQTPFCVPLGKFVEKKFFYSLPNLNEKVFYQDAIFTAQAINLSNKILHINKSAGIYNYKRPSNSMSYPWEGKRYQTEIQICIDLLKLDAQEIVAIHVMRKKFRKLLKINRYTFPIKRKFKFSFMPFCLRWIMWLIYFVILKKRFRYIKKH